MKAILEISKSTYDEGGCFSAAANEMIPGIRVREVRLLGLKIIREISTSFVTETWFFALLIKRSRQKGWEIYHYPIAKP